MERLLLNLTMVELWGEGCQVVCSMAWCLDKQGSGLMVVHIAMIYRIELFALMKWNKRIYLQGILANWSLKLIRDLLLFCSLRVNKNMRNSKHTRKAITKKYYLKWRQYGLRMLAMMAKCTLITAEAKIFLIKWLKIFLPAAKDYWIPTAPSG